MDEPEYLWAVGCNRAFKREQSGEYVLDKDYSVSNAWLQQLVRSGLLSSEIAFDYDEVPDGTPLILLPIGSQPEAAQIGSSKETTRAPLPLAAIAGGLAISVAGSAIYDGLKAGAKAVTSSGSSTGIYNMPTQNPRPPVRPSGPFAF